MGVPAVAALGLLMRHLLALRGAPQLPGQDSAEDPQGVQACRWGQLVPERRLGAQAGWPGARGRRGPRMRGLAILRTLNPGAADTTRPAGAAPAIRLWSAVWEIDK